MYTFSEISPANQAQVKLMLANEGLPTEDFDTVNWFALRGAWVDGTLVSAGGLEQVEKELLLRSVVTDDAHRGQGLAYQVVNQLQDQAKSEGYTCISLLTLDQQDYFRRKLGYHEINRNDVSAAISNSAQFRGICPANASLMQLNLKNH